MEIKLTVPAKYIAVLKLFAAQKDMRQYLNGICLEIGRTESLIVATNGHILGCFRVVNDEPGITEPERNIIIGLDLLELIKSSKGFVQFCIGSVIPHSNSRPVTIIYNGESVVGRTEDARYPDWRRVIPGKVSDEAAQFNAEYIGRLAKAWGYLHGKTDPLVTIAHNGGGCALIGLGCEDFVGGIMPMDFGGLAIRATAPDWVSDFALGRAEPEKADLEVAA